MPDSPAKTIDPVALSPGDAARLLTKAGGRLITEATIQCDIDDGAPTNADGTFNLVNYTAWLVQEAARGD